MEQKATILSDISFCRRADVQTRTPSALLYAAYLKRHWPLLREATSHLDSHSGRNPCLNLRLSHGLASSVQTAPKFSFAFPGLSADFAKSKRKGLFLRKVGSGGFLPNKITLALMSRRNAPRWDLSHMHALHTQAERYSENKSVAHRRNISRLTLLRKQVYRIRSPKDGPAGSRIFPRFDHLH